MFTSLIWLLFAASPSYASQPSLQAALGQAVAQCKAVPAGAQHVWIFKQWHADAGVDTHDRAKARAMPQVTNQIAIYRQLDEWIGAGALKTLVAEGCSGELTRASKLRINGWSVGELEAESKKPHYDEIVTSIPEKLEAKYGEKLRTLCGDDDALIREQNLTSSDIRGTFGFLSRLMQFKNDPGRVRNYLDGVIELYKLPKTTTSGQAVIRLKTELRNAIGRFRAVIEKRNEQAVSVIRSSHESQVAIVFGGAHAPGLMRALESKAIGCTVVEPEGYQNNEALLIEDLEQALKKMDAEGA